VILTDSNEKDARRRLRVLIDIERSILNDRCRST
jgi:hypothetical protein